MSLTAIREHILEWQQVNLPVFIAAQDAWKATHDHYCICSWTHELEVSLDGSLNGGQVADQTWDCMDLSSLGIMPARAQMDIYTSINERSWILTLETLYNLRWYHLKYGHGQDAGFVMGWEQFNRGEA